MQDLTLPLRGANALSSMWTDCMNSDCSHFLMSRPSAVFIWNSSKCKTAISKEATGNMSDRDEYGLFAYESWEVFPLTSRIA